MLAVCVGTEPLQTHSACSSPEGEAAGAGRGAPAGGRGQALDTGRSLSCSLARGPRPARLGLCTRSATCGARRHCRLRRRNSGSSALTGFQCTLPKPRLHLWAIEDLLIRLWPLFTLLYLLALQIPSLPYASLHPTHVTNSAVAPSALLLVVFMEPCLPGTGLGSGPGVLHASWWNFPPNLQFRLYYYLHATDEEAGLEILCKCTQVTQLVNDGVRF